VHLSVLDTFTNTEGQNWVPYMCECVYWGLGVGVLCLREREREKWKKKKKKDSSKRQTITSFKFFDSIVSNVRSRGISRGARKLARTPKVIKKKNVR
jgi:hypothetical protein